jgi:hypothetical protein
MGIMDEFDPAVDGWSFQNWGEDGIYCIGSCDLSWDLYRKAYLGINPTHDCVEAPLDCAFYEGFKIIAEKGNCGGMSLLALALFKYGGYMGFCSPASFYTGVANPAGITHPDGTVEPDWMGTDREDLHRAINILQARQFSAGGVENFLDVVDVGNLNNAVEAFERAKALLASGDYPLLSIATSTFAEEAHTVIPFKCEESPAGYPAGTRVMHIWDPNHPYPQDPAHYQGVGPGTPFHMVIRSATDWEYTSGTRLYPDGWDGWCFTVPMSAILGKQRQPAALDMVFDALMTAFISGPAAAIMQVTDGNGHRLYTSDGVHLRRGDLETDPTLRLKGVGRWPWYGGTGDGELPGELYFMRRGHGASDLEFKVSGSQYKMMATTAGNLLEIEVESAQHSADLVRVSRLGTASRAVEIQALDQPRRVTVRQLRGDVLDAEWKSVEVRSKEVGRSGLLLRAVGDLEAMEVSSRDRPVRFDLEVAQRREGVVTRLPAKGLATVEDRALHVAPADWQHLDGGKLHVIERGPAVLRPWQAQR